MNTLKVLDKIKKKGELYAVNIKLGDKTKEIVNLEEKKKNEK